MWQYLILLGPRVIGSPHSPDKSFAGAGNCGLVRLFSVAERSRSRFIRVTLNRTVSPGNTT